MTPSALQSDTARINGAKSQGPVTEEGKAASAMNSLKHGLCSKQAVLPGEDQAEYDRHLADYIKSFQPRNQIERDLVETMVASRWRLNRLMRLEAALLDNVEDANQVLKTMSLLMRYENQLNRSYDKAFQYLMMLKQNLRPTRLPVSMRNEPKPVDEIDAEVAAQIHKIMRAPLPNGK